MKRIITWIDLFILMFLLLPCPLLAEEFKGLATEDGWIRGTITVTDAQPWMLYVDCPVPEAAYPLELIKTGNRFFSKKDMQRGLKAAGQNTQGSFANNRTYTKYEGSWNARADADISHEDAAAQAVRIGLLYFDAMGVEVAREPRIVTRPYDCEALMEQQYQRLAHSYADPQPMIERSRAQIARTLKYAPKQSAYTEVTFDVLLKGQRIPSNYSWPTPFPDEPDAQTGDSTEASVIVSDSGILVSAATRNIKEVKSRQPLSPESYESYFDMLAKSCNGVLPAATWQEALRLALGDPRLTGMNFSASQIAEEHISLYGTPNVKLPYKTVLVRMYPCLNTVRENVFIPGWAFDSVQTFTDGFRIN